PLTASLSPLAALPGRAVSREALLGGLPITDGRLSVSLYDRAAVMGGEIAQRRGEGIVAQGARPTGRGRRCS
ncbi:hypothetical protein, partial [Bradyrhizobium uaiense]